MTCPICDKKPMNCDCTVEERRMHAEIEDLEEQVPRWISVAERLPEIKDRVIVNIDGRTMVAYRCNAVSEFCAWIGDDGYAMWPPSHWMPLPEPPK